MRTVDFRPSPHPPVSERDLGRYAGKWVVVRGRKVVLQATRFDALMAALASERLKDDDEIHHLPPR